MQELFRDPEIERLIQGKRGSLSPQYPHFRSTWRDEPVQKLAMGILIQAVRDLLSGDRTGRQCREWCEDARSWFYSPDEYPGSFEWVCGVLQIDPDWFRRNLPSPRTEEEQRSKLLRKLAWTIPR